MKISLITICHKSKKDILRYTTSFLKYHSLEKTEMQYEFIFVENSGQPGLREVIQPLADGGFKVVVLDSDNEGFGIACNLGAQNSTGDLLLFVNPDIQFMNSLEPLAEFQENGSWGTVRQLTPRGKTYSVDFLPEHKNILCELTKVRLLLNKNPRLFLTRCYAVGSFLVVERSIFETVGGFNSAFFMYHEEAELCRRLHLFGGPLFIDNGVTVVHEGFGSHETLEQALEFEAQGFLTYCKVTSQLHLIRSRLRNFRLLGYFSKIARQRYSLLEKIASEERD